MNKWVKSISVASALLISFSNLQLPSASANKKFKAEAVLLNNSDRKPCKGNFLVYTTDFAAVNSQGSLTWTNQLCVIKVFINSQVSGEMFLQLKQGAEWLDMSSNAGWADSSNLRVYKSKINSKRNLGKVSGATSWTCTFKSDCVGTFDFSIPHPYAPYSNEDGAYCYNPSIQSAEFRIRISSSTGQYFTNVLKATYLNAEKVVKKGFNCVVGLATASTEKPAAGGTPSKKLPSCTIAQIREKTGYLKDFNEWRSLYVDAVAIAKQSRDGVENARFRGDSLSEQNWTKNYLEATALARTLTADALKAQNSLIELAQRCSDGYGIVITEPYGFVVTDEKITSYSFPEFPIP